MLANRTQTAIIRTEQPLGLLGAGWWAYKMQDFETGDWDVELKVGWLGFGLLWVEVSETAWFRLLQAHAVFFLISAFFFSCHHYHEAEIPPKTNKYPWINKAVVATYCIARFCKILAEDKWNAQILMMYCPCVSPADAGNFGMTCLPESRFNMWLTLWNGGSLVMLMHQNYLVQFWKRSWFE